MPLPFAADGLDGGAHLRQRTIQNAQALQIEQRMDNVDLRNLRRRPHDVHRVGRYTRRPDQASRLGVTQALQRSLALAEHICISPSGVEVKNINNIPV